MKTYLECLPCFLKQSIIALTLSGVSQELERGNSNGREMLTEIISAITEEIKRADFSKPPAWTTTFIHKRIREILKTDPFKEVKSKYNRIANSLYSELRNMVFRSPDPLWTATRLAIAGNGIDFGIFSSVDIEGTIARGLDGKLEVNHYELFKKSLSSTSQCLYLLDNAGEVVFDRILMEVLRDMGIRVIAVVKGAPVLNDCTMEDAFEISLHDVAEVIDNGSDAIGTIFEFSSPYFKEIFQEIPLIISKGQGNFETLSSYLSAPRLHSCFQPQDCGVHKSKRIFFLFQSKCEVVSRELKLPVGSMLLFSPSSQTCA